jgi:Aspartyl protease
MPCVPSNEFASNRLVVSLMARLLNIAASILAASAIASAQAASPSAGKVTAGKNPVAQIPITVGCGKAVFVQGRIRGSAPLNLLVDSGGGSSYLLDTERAHALGLDPQRRFNLEGGGENQPAAFATRGEAIELPGVTLNPPSIVLTDFHWLEERCGLRIDGMIGYDLFRRYTVKINFAKNLLELYKSDVEYAGKGDRVPLWEDAEHMLSIPAELSVDGEPERQVKLVVDTGDALVPIAFTREFVENYEFLKKLKRGPQQSRIEGLGGRTHLNLAQVKSLRIGGYVFRDLQVGLSEDQNGGLAHGDYDGVLGAEILSKFNLIFDLAHKQLILESNFLSPIASGLEGSTQ